MLIKTQRRRQRRLLRQAGSFEGGVTYVSRLFMVFGIVNLLNEIKKSVEREWERGADKTDPI